MAAVGSIEWAKEQIAAQVDLRLQHSVDKERGGYHENLTDGYEPVGGDEARRKHIVNTCRGIYCFSAGAILLKERKERCKEAVLHGLRMLEGPLWDAEHAGYHWEVQVTDRGELEKVTEGQRLCYGHAFVLLAMAMAHKAGVVGAEKVATIYEILEKRFWRGDEGLYADLASPDWKEVDSYRGQNANMHMVEALLASYAATHETAYLTRARLVASTFCNKLPEAPGAAGLIWEHYREGGEHDWGYNRLDVESWVGADPTKLGIREYRPWGLLPGHHAEWAKLLLLLHRVDPTPPDWAIARAEHLLTYTMSTGWDADMGGLFYATAPDLRNSHPQIAAKMEADGRVVNDGKFVWPVAEAFAALWLLSQKKPAWEERYRTVVEYGAAHMTGKAKGVWWSRLDRANNRVCEGIN
eukprot:Sspe_Gene.34380::Locus_16717_Transcript_1_1_Confidence_1.000_Length_1283::g.34380::m.34380